MSKKPAKPPAPTPAIIFCPNCHKQHIDRGAWATRHHYKHLCEHCKHLWTPVPNVYVVGVEKVIVEVSDHLLTKLDLAKAEGQGYTELLEEILGLFGV